MNDDTVGSLLLRRSLPPGYDHRTVDWSKKGVKALLTEIAERDPDKYAEVLQNLTAAGRLVGHTDGGSLSLAQIRTAPSKRAILEPVHRKIEEIQNSNLSEDERNAQVVELLREVAPRLQAAIYDESVLDDDNLLAQQMKSGAKGNKSNLSSLRGADLLYEDHNGDPVPMAVMNSYAEGLDPVEYWAGTYGGRKGLVDLKFAVADAGYYGKRLANAVHRLVVTDEEPAKSRLPVGLPTTADDDDNVGSVLAQEVAGYPAGTVITSSVLGDLRRKTKGSRFLVHSPITSIAPGGGIDRLSAGVREKMMLSPIGDNIGLAASQSVSERVSQGLISSKHTGGVSSGAKNEFSGFKYIDSLAEAPGSMPQAGIVADADGHVTGVEDAPQGGKFIYMGDKKFYVAPHRTVKVKAGDTVEAGDLLTDGIPHPAELVRHKGIGEARRMMSTILIDAFKNSGVPAHRRNAEIVATGLINHVRITNPDGIGDNIVDDVVPYAQLYGRGYTPRTGAQRVAPSAAYGKYLEEPVLHYTPGTRVTKAVQRDLDEFKVPEVDVHDSTPDFEPQFVRGIMNLYHDPDWMTQLGGFYTGKAFQKSVQRGAKSETKSTSFYPGLATGTDFGTSLSSEGKY